MMNWGNLGKSGRGNGKRGGGGRGGAAGAMGTGLDAAWKEASLPKEGDMLKCKHFNVCPGCEFDRRFDETPIMIDSRYVHGCVRLLQTAFSHRSMVAGNWGWYDGALCLLRTH